MTTKKCSTCKNYLPLSNFSDNSRKKDGKHNMCKPCHTGYRRQHYLNNKDKYIKKADVYKKVMSAWLKEYKSKLSCTKCGENHPACLDFHHINDDKEADVSFLVHRASKKKVLAEIDKCIVVCRNCHAKIHYDEKHG